VFKLAGRLPCSRCAEILSLPVPADDAGTGA
jgi:hypothetical protein